MEIKKYTAVNKGNLVGFLSVHVPKWGVTIHSIGVFKKGSARWVNLPSREYEQDGEKKFAQYIQFDSKELKDLFGERILAALDEYLKTHQEEKAPEPSFEEVPF